MRKGKILYTVAAAIMAAALMLTGCSKAREDLNTNLGTENSASNLSTSISLNRTFATVDGKGARVEGSVVTILDAGEYTVSGELKDGQLVVDVSKKDKVRLIFDGVTIHSETSAPLYIKQCDKCTIILNDGTVNTLSDSEGLVYDDSSDEVPNAALYCKGDLTFMGKGTLSIAAVFNHAIKCKGKLSFKNGAYNITAKEDAIHSSKELTIENGVYNISCGDDAIHCDKSLIIDNGTISIEKCYEGLEALSVTINNGDIRIYSQDDGINAAGGDGSGEGSPFDFGKRDNPFAITEGASVVVNGGNLYVNAQGDGIDTNGDFLMNGGNIMIDGPESGANGALDHNGDAIVTGGTIVASGTGGMLECFGEDSTQNVLLVYFDGTIDAGSKVEVKDRDGGIVLTYSIAKKSQCAIMSCEKFVTGETYTVYVNSGQQAQITVDAVISSNGDIPKGYGGFGGFGGDKKGGFGKP